LDNDCLGRSATCCTQATDRSPTVLKSLTGHLLYTGHWPVTYGTCH